MARDARVAPVGISTKDVPGPSSAARHGLGKAPRRSRVCALDDGAGSRWRSPPRRRYSSSRPCDRKSLPKEVCCGRLSRPQVYYG
jgi:hypothetical protein